MAGAALSQGQVQISWHAQHFRKVKFSQGLNCVTGTALSKGEVQISWQAQHIHKVKFSQGLNCVAGAALSKGQVQVSWQAQHFREVQYRFRGSGSTFARSSTDFVAGAALSQVWAQIDR